MNLRLMFKKALGQMGIFQQPVQVAGHVRATPKGQVYVPPYQSQRKRRVPTRDIQRTKKKAIVPLLSGQIALSPAERALHNTSPVVQTIRLIATDRQWTHPVAWEAPEWAGHRQVVLDALNMSEPELITRLAWLGLHQVERDASGLPIYTDSGGIKPTGGEDELKRALWRAAQPDLTKGIQGGGHHIDYKTEFQGLAVTIENRKGSIRHWKNPETGEEGDTKFEYPYGFIHDSQGLDGEELDCFLGPHVNASHAYLITQLKGPDYLRVDEQKAMLGFDSAESAVCAYLEHYNRPDFFWEVTAMPMQQFKQRVVETTTKPWLMKSIQTLYEERRLLSYLLE